MMVILAGAYVIMVSVYSHSLFLSYEVAAIVFLIAGVITTVVGLKLKRQEATLVPANPIRP